MPVHQQDSDVNTTAAIAGVFHLDDLGPQDQAATRTLFAPTGGGRGSRRPSSQN